MGFKLFNSVYCCFCYFCPATFQRRIAGGDLGSVETADWFILCDGQRRVRSFSRVSTQFNYHQIS